MPQGTLGCPPFSTHSQSHSSIYLFKKHLLKKAAQRHRSQGLHPKTVDPLLCPGPSGLATGTRPPPSGDRSRGRDALRTAPRRMSWLVPAQWWVYWAPEAEPQPGQGPGCLPSTRAWGAQDVFRAGKFSKKKHYKANKSACVLSHVSRVRLFVTSWSIARQAPPSMGLSRQEYWSGMPCPPPGGLPDPGIEPRSPLPPASAGGFFTTSATWEAPQSETPS